MKVEELIKYRDKFNDILIVHQKKIKKWGILCVICYIVGLLSILIPMGIVGDNQGQAKPPVYNVFIIMGIIVLLAAVFSTIFYTYHRVIILQNKK